MTPIIGLIFSSVIVRTVNNNDDVAHAQVCRRPEGLGAAEVAGGRRSLATISTRLHFQSGSMNTNTGDLEQGGRCTESKDEHEMCVYK